MDTLFTFLQDHRGGILLFLLVLAGIALLVQWFAWIFALGRFGSTTPSGGKAELRYIFSEAAVKIINDFRHLLALVIVLIFAFALGYSLIKAATLPTTGESTSVINNMKEALQAVVATLGGLVGSIIGYYFGESSVTKAPVDGGGTKPSPEIQTNAPDGEQPSESIKPAPKPPPRGSSTAANPVNPTAPSVPQSPTPPDTANPVNPATPVETSPAALADKPDGGS